MFLLLKVTVSPGLLPFRRQGMGVVEWCGVEFDEVVWGGVVWCGVGVEWCGVEFDRVVWGGAV